MAAISFNSVLIIAGISVLVPVVLGLLPRFRVPGVVLQVVAGIIVGPSVLGWARIDPAVKVLSDLGLGMLLFLAGLEIDVDRLRGPLARLAGVAFAVSAALGLLCAFFFWLAGQAEEPFLLAIILMSTSAGLLLPLLKDAGEAATEFGQLVMTAAAVAEIVPIMLMSLFFSAASKTTADQLVSLAIFLALLILIGLTLARVRRLRGLDRLLDHLENRSGQLRVRATLTLALACGVLAYRFGFASILGAFAAGLLVRLIEFSGREPNPQFMAKLEGIGFGFLIPIFFISTGVAFQLKALLSHPVALAEVPLFLIALLAVRGLPALLYRRSMGTRRAAAAGLLQATTLTFVIVATEIGVATEKLTPTAAAALVAAGLLSAALFPAGATRLLTHLPPSRPRHTLHIMDVALRAVVAGGGIGGLAAAVALSRAGIDVQVHEQARELTEVGAGVALAPNGLRILERLGVGEGVARLGARHVSTQLRLADGQPASHEPHQFARPGRNVGIHRADLLALLASQLPDGTVLTGHRCTGFSQDPGRATVVFADGTTASADLVIGADGIHSVLQGFVAAPAEPVFSGVVAYRGLVPRLAEYPADTMRMWVGEGKHFLVFPVRAGQLLNYVGFVPSGTSVRESWSAAGDPVALAAQFADWDPVIGRVIAAITGPGGSGFQWGMYDRAPLPRWSSGRLTLLGDAAHPMLPHLGQGVNQALEDAAALATLLAANASSADVPRALTAYEELRRERTARVQLGSRRNGAGYDSSGSQLTDRRWIYEYDAWAEAVALASAMRPA